MTRSTFAIPALLALVCVVGLVTALTGDGWRDAVGWISLALPVTAVAVSAIRAVSARRARPSSRHHHRKTVS